MGEGQPPIAGFVGEFRPSAPQAILTCRGPKVPGPQATRVAIRMPLLAQQRNSSDRLFGRTRTSLGIGEAGLIRCSPSSA